MSTEENKQIVKNFFDLVNKKELAKAFELFTEDLHWWIIGNAKVSGDRDKRTMQIGLKMLHRQFETFQFVLHDFTAEDNRVAVTAESKGKHSSGKDYNNHYHFLIELEGGKIKKVKEYFDTAHAIWLEGG